MSRDSVRIARLDRRTNAGIVAGAKAAQLFDRYCPAQLSPVQANDEPLTMEQREKLVAYRRNLLETTGKVFTGNDENFLDILAQ